MGMVIGDNFDYKGKKPLDARMLFDTIADMKAYNENYLPDITLAFNKADGNMYVFNRTNDVDVTTGKWREFEGGATPEVIPEVSTVAELTTYLESLTDTDYHKVNLTAEISFPAASLTIRLGSSVYAVQRMNNNNIFAFKNEKIYKFNKANNARTVSEVTEEYMKSDVYELEMDTAYTVEDFFDEVSISVRNHNDVIYVDQYGTGTLTTTDGTEIAGEFHMILDAGNDNGIRGGKIYQFNEDGEYVEQYNVMVDVAEGTINVIKKEGTKSVYLTQTEFNALTQEEQDDPTKDYYITSNGQPVPVEGIKITDMDDVSITAPLVDDETLVFDEQTQVFKNKDINSYFKDTEEKSVTLGGSNNSTNGIYGMLFPNRKIYLKDITITFNTEETSYNWYIYRINGSVAVGATVTVIDSGTGVVDQPLTVNHRFKEDEVFAIGDAATFKYGQQGQSDYALIRFNGNTIQQVLTGFYYNCTYTYEEYVDKYLTIEEAEKISSNILTGKKIMLLGDSMTAGHSTPVANRRATILGEKNNMTVDNRASNGAYMYDDETSGYKDVSIYKKVCDTTATNYIPDSAFEGVDYIIVYGGTNDVKSGSVTLGDVDSNDPSDFCGAVNAICNTLQTRAPSAHIGFITPLVYANSKTTSLAFNQAIKDVCAKYSIPVYDQGAESGINRGNATIVSTLTLGDGIHLNNAGHAFVEQKYEAFIRRI